MSLFVDEDPTDDGLIERIQERIKAGIRQVAPDSPAARDWKRFSEIYTATIRRMAKSCGLPANETQELENDVWVAFLNSLPNYRPSGLPG